MIKPPKLNPGDTVATISLSWGGAGEFPHRYQAGKQQLMDTFGVNVIETTHSQRSAEWLERNPKARADDLHEALLNPDVKAIISNIGGDDSIRLLPYVDLDLIQRHPKIFIGFSDSTITHFMFYKAGVTSFYGTSLLVGFAENGGMHAYQREDIQRSLFSTDPVGEIIPSPTWTSEHLCWQRPENQRIPRVMTESRGWRWLQGSGKASGTLLGGCIEVLEFIKDTALWVEATDWEGKILFIETSEDQPVPNLLKWWLRNYAASGILSRLSGILLGRPQSNQYWEEYDAILLQVVRDEERLTDLPIISGMDFGHACPTFTLPLGCKAEIDTDERRFSIIESGVR